MRSEAHEKNKNTTLQALRDAFVKSTLYAIIQSETKAWMKNVGLPQENCATKNPIVNTGSQDRITINNQKTVR